MSATAADFERLVSDVAEGWATGDVDRALSAFASDAVYMEPPEEQLFRGHGELRPYFAAVPSGTLMRLHRIWFDEGRQAGAIEYTFAAGPADSTADHGVAVLELRDGRIAHWREYQAKGPADRERFLAVDGKRWRWHGGNYP
jgi:ketosteroid isomerase-like protein